MEQTTEAEVINTNSVTINDNGKTFEIVTKCTDPEQLFLDKKNFVPMLQQVKKIARGLVADPTTKEGASQRKALSRKISAQMHSGFIGHKGVIGFYSRYFGRVVGIEAGKKEYSVQKAFFKNILKVSAHVADIALRMINGINKRIQIGDKNKDRLKILHLIENSAVTQSVLLKCFFVLIPLYKLVGDTAEILQYLRIAVNIRGTVARGKAFKLI